MDDWMFRRDLIEPARLKALSARSDLRGAAQAASHFGAIAATGYLLSRSYGTLWCVPVFILHGVLLNYLYAAQHELLHRTAFRSRWLNDALRQVTGLLLIYPSGADQMRHFQHHRHTKDPERDSEIQNRVPLDFRSYVRRLHGFFHWNVRVTTLLRHAFREVDEFYLAAAAKREVATEARLYLAVYALVAAVSVALDTWAAVWYWLLPMVLTKWAHQIHTLTEHSGLPNVTDIRISTRTVLGNRFMRWIVWNMCYHAGHHLYPGVPFHALPRLHEAVRSHLGVIEPNYLAAHRSMIRTARRQSRVVAHS